MREMKESGIRYIGKIPSNWDVKRVKYVSDSISKGNGITKDQVYDDGDIQCVRYGEIYSKYNNSFETTYSRTTTNGISSPKHIRKGDILFAGTGELIEEIGKNIVYLGNEPCLAGGDIVVLKHHQNASFLNYALNASCSQHQKSEGKAKLKVVHISSTDIGNIRIALPSIDEQTRIADYLDSQCSEIDALSTDIQSEIDTLEAYKRSVITEAVTKGLDKNAPMKDSGIKWIGMIPKHWGVKKIKYTLINRTENNNPIRTTDILSLTAKQGVIPLDEREGGGNKPKEDVSAYRLAYPNDIVMNSMNILSGSVGLSKYFGCVSPVYYMLRPKNADDDIRYFHDIFQTRVFQRSLRGLGNGILIKETENGTLNTIRMRIPMDTLGNIKLPVPPSNEQKQIADYVDSKIFDIDSILEQKEKQLEVLAEYKKSVIYEYVTGKKEVP